VPTSKRFSRFLTHTRFLLGISKIKKIMADRPWKMSNVVAGWRRLMHGLRILTNPVTLLDAYPYAGASVRPAKNAVIDAALPPQLQQVSRKKKRKKRKK
jgi:hypothetical protein